MDHSRLSMPLGEAIFTQRSIRRFKPDAIPLEDIHLILEAAAKAPNGGNQQVARFLVVNDPARIREFGHPTTRLVRSGAAMRGSERSRTTWLRRYDPRGGTRRRDARRAVCHVRVGDA